MPFVWAKQRVLPLSIGVVRQLLVRLVALLLFKLVGEPIVINYIKYHSLYLSLYGFILGSWHCFSHRDIFSLLFIDCSWNVFSLVFNGIVVSYILSLWDLNLNSLCFHFNDWFLEFSVFHSGFTSDGGLNLLDWLDILDLWLDILDWLSI